MLLNLHVVMEVEDDELPMVKVADIVEKLRVQTDENRMPVVQGVLKNDFGTSIGAYKLERTWLRQTTIHH